jgi:hypothetical protein
MRGLTSRFFHEWLKNKFPGKKIKTRRSSGKTWTLPVF